MKKNLIIILCFILLLSLFACEPAKPGTSADESKAHSAETSEDTSEISDEPSGTESEDNSVDETSSLPPEETSEPEEVYLWEADCGDSFSGYKLRVKEKLGEFTMDGNTFEIVKGDAKEKELSFNPRVYKDCCGLAYGDKKCLVAARWLCNNAEIYGKWVRYVVTSIGIEKQDERIPGSLLLLYTSENGIPKVEKYLEIGYFIAGDGIDYFLVFSFGHPPATVSEWKIFDYSGNKYELPLNKELIEQSDYMNYVIDMRFAGGDDPYEVIATDKNGKEYVLNLKDAKQVPMNDVE